MLAGGYGRWGGIGKNSRELGWPTSNQDGLGIYIRHMSTAGVDRETRRIPTIQQAGIVSHDRELDRINPTLKTHDVGRGTG